VNARVCGKKAKNSWTRTELSSGGKTTVSGRLFGGTSSQRSEGLVRKKQLKERLKGRSSGTSLQTHTDESPPAGSIVILHGEGSGVRRSGLKKEV